VPRSGAQAGDVVCVTGKIGNAVRSGWHLRFVPRAKESRALVKRFRLNAMIDLSDGLGSDVLKLCRASRKGVIVYRHLIPLRRGARTLGDILYQGEDYELLFTAASREVSAMMRRSRALGFKIFPIGEIVENEATRVLVDGARTIPIVDKGFTHF
jgi:thiamine-monophosphate kinase